jgi:hypothetical protein
MVMADTAKTLRDAAYVVVGAGVLAFQKAQVRRVELTKQLETQRTLLEAQAAEARDQLAKLVKSAEERWEPVLKDLETRLDDIESRLPEQAGKVMKQARTVAKEAQTRFTAAA